MQIEWQIVLTMIRLLQEQSDLGLHCLLRTICLNTQKVCQYYLKQNFIIFLSLISLYFFSVFLILIYPKLYCVAVGLIRKSFSFDGLKGYVFPCYPD